MRKLDDLATRRMAIYDLLSLCDYVFLQYLQPEVVKVKCFSVSHTFASFICVLQENPPPRPYR